MKKLKSKKGITLIALIITIIILLILSGVAISSLTRNGLFEKVQLAKQKQEESTVKEKINLLVSEYAINREQEKTLLQFLEEKKKSKEIDDFIDNNNGTFDIVINGYTITITESDLSTTEPVITSDILTILLAKKFVENKIQSVITIKSKSIGIKEIKIINDVVVQGNNKKEISFDYLIETNTEYEVEVELTNGTKYKKTVKYEDIEGPTAIIEIPTKLFFKSGIINAKIKLIDNKSGVNIEKCKWTVVKNSEKLGTEDESLYTGTFNNIEQEIKTENITEEGDYFIHLLLKDNVGNTTEVISEKITIKNGYAISTPEDLQAIKTDLSGNYFVINDIDMTGVDFQIISGFVGTLDGQGHTISNFTTTTGGMFSNMDYVKKITIKNICFKNVKISGVYSYGTALVSAGSCDFEKVGITGTVTRLGPNYAAGLLGYGKAYGSTFINCYSRVEIENAYNYYCGGLYGYIEKSGNIESCYYSGAVPGFRQAESIKNCYYDVNKFAAGGEVSSSYGIGLNTTDFSNKDNFIGWDFTNDWYIDEETGYPELQF